MRKLFIFISSVFICVPQAYSQNNDFGLWTSFGIEKKLAKNIELDFGVANRLKDNLNQRDESFADIGISYRIADFAAGFGYRFTDNFDQERDFRLSHRFAWQIRYRPDWERFSFDYRFRFQSQYFSIKGSENGYIPDNFIRNRLKVSYNIKKSAFEPYASYEYFFRLNQMGPNQFERRRLTLGMEYKINKDNSLGLEWIFHETFNVKDPARLYVIGLEYKLEI